MLIPPREDIIQIVHWFHVENFGPHPMKDGPEHVTGLGSGLRGLQPYTIARSFAPWLIIQVQIPEARHGSSSRTTPYSLQHAQETNISIVG